MRLRIYVRNSTVAVETPAAAISKIDQSITASIVNNNLPTTIMEENKQPLQSPQIIMVERPNFHRKHNLIEQQRTTRPIQQEDLFSSTETTNTNNNRRSNNEGNGGFPAILTLEEDGKLKRLLVYNTRQLQEAINEATKRNNKVKQIQGI